MSDLNAFTVLDDTSTLIRFDSVWATHLAIYTGKLDSPGLDPYLNRTYITTNRDDGCMRVAFVGTKVSVFGTLRSNHGWYSALIDQDPASAEREFKDGYSEQEITNSTLFTATVPMGTHRLYIYNEPKYNAVKGLDVFGLDAVQFDGYAISWEEAEAEPQPQPQPQPEPQPEPTISTTATTSSTSDVVVAAAATVSSPIGQPVPSGYAPPDKVVSSFASTSSQSAISSSSTESLSSATPLLSPPNIQPQTVDGPKQEAVAPVAFSGAGHEKKSGSIMTLLFMGFIASRILGQ